MEDMGMSDLQFKSFLKQLVKRIEAAKELADDADLITPEFEEMLRQLNDIVDDLRSDIES